MHYLKHRETSRYGMDMDIDKYELSKHGNMHVIETNNEDDIQSNETNIGLEALRVWISVDIVKYELSKLVIRHVLENNNEDDILSNETNNVLAALRE